MKQRKRIGCLLLAGVMLCSILASAVPQYRSHRSNALVLSPGQKSSYQMKVGNQVQLSLNLKKPENNTGTNTNPNTNPVPTGTDTETNTEPAENPSGNPSPDAENTQITDNPAQPQENSDIATPNDPNAALDLPTEPAEPTQPSEPAQPENPAAPEDPNQPDTPTQPENPTQPSTPVDMTVKWYSSNAAVASVTANGLVTAAQEGTAVIYGESAQGTASLTVTVAGYVIQDITVTAPETMKVGETKVISAKLIPEQAKDPVQWQNLDPAALHIDSINEQTGTIRVTALKEIQSARLRVSAGDASKTFSLSISGYHVEAIDLDLHEEMEYQTIQHVTAHITPIESSDVPITWLSSNPRIIQISETGVMEAVGLGTASIAASTPDGTIRTIAHVTVNGSIELNTSNLTMYQNNSYALSASVSPETAPISWTSNNPAIVTVHPTTGQLVASSVNSGFAIVSAVSGGLTETCRIEVKAKNNAPSINHNNGNTNHLSTPQNNNGNPNGTTNSANGAGNHNTSPLPNVQTMTGLGINDLDASGGVLHIPSSTVMADFLYQVPTNIPPSVYLTIDCNSLDTQTETVLTALERNAIPATFFIPVNDLYHADEMLRHITGSRNNIGFLLTPEQAASENAVAMLEEANENLSVITGLPSRIVRIAGGSSGNISSETAERLLDAGYRLWDWNIDAQENTLTAEQSYTVISSAMDSRDSVAVRFGCNGNVPSVLEQLIPFLRYCGIAPEAITAGDSPVFHTAVG